jgi:O-antigen ligase
MLFPDGRVYGFWQPLDRSAQPFGPIINRNHFAAWTAMAAALGLGGLAAHVARRREHVREGRAAIAALSDTRGLWLLFAASVTVAATLATASRSGVAALAAAGAAAAVLIRRHLGRRASLIALAAALVCVVAAFNWSRPDRLLTRIGAMGGELGLRQTIWDQSLEIAARYPLTGVGAGAFPAAMTYYQHGPRTAFFNHAHNQYIEMAAEGGLLLGIPLLLLAAGLVRGIMRQLRTPRRATFWLRAGATAALAGLAVCCIWESPFRTPATLMLAAVAAGLATGRE